MAENVVKLKQSGRLDLRGNNRLPELLETHVEQAAIIAEATKLKKAADAEINAIIGDAEYVRADGYEVSITTYHVDEYTVKASDRRRMTVRTRKERK